MEHPNTEGTTNPAASALQDAARDPKGAADQAARQVGDTLKSAAEHVREQMPDSGIVGQVADAVSERDQASGDPSARARFRGDD